MFHNRGQQFLMARFNLKYTKLTFIMFCASIEEAEKGCLERPTTASHSRVTIAYAVCDRIIYRSRFGKDNEGHDAIMGTDGCGNINDNGHRLYDSCEKNNLSFGGTLILVMALCTEGKDENFVSE